ncbi:MAG TPA: outer membrane lipoprotein chaperone LolA [Casimicrobiaceae bacterium]
MNARAAAILATRRVLCAGWLACAAALSATSAAASGLDQLHAFLEGTKTAQGSFRQTVVNKSKRTTQATSGTFAFARPGKFRWTYDKPFDQLIVGDGEKVWIYDRDLNQVIVRRLDAALGSTPAALLAGDNALEKNFTLVAGGAADGVEYVDATPKAAESQFTRIRLGFADDLPRRMELTDAFGQTTELTFTDVKRNPQLPAETFRFTPPKGADVVGQ